ncbi:MAG: pilus assembly protein [Chloroflexi bacterium]|nr:pilus assembly protein [Chloroflexota bacterium]
MALILPFLLAFAGGATDLARAYQAWLTIESAARNAAEYVATTSADAATALADARHAVCQESQPAPGFTPGSAPNAIINCTAPTVTVPSFVISTVQTGASAANPIATAQVRATLPFNTIFPYPFVPHDGWTLTGDATYSVVRGR